MLQIYQNNSVFCKLSRPDEQLYLPIQVPLPEVARVWTAVVQRSGNGPCFLLSWHIQEHPPRSHRARVSHNHRMMQPLGPVLDTGMYMKLTEFNFTEKMQEHVFFVFQICPQFFFLPPSQNKYTYHISKSQLILNFTRFIKRQYQQLYIQIIMLIWNHEY